MKLDEIQQMLDAATPGPWPMIDIAGACYHGMQGPSTFEDARLIAACPQLIQALLDVARAAKQVAEGAAQEFEARRQLDALDRTFARLEQLELK